MSIKNLHNFRKYAILILYFDEEGRKRKVLNRLYDKMHAFLNGKASALLYTLTACVTVSFSLENYAIPLFILWILFALLLEKSFLNVFLPMTLLCGFAIRTSGQSTYLLNHVWLAIPVVIVFVLHFIIHGVKLRRGKLFLAQCGISVALLLGGAFCISPADYFKADSLYYVLFLGIGMLFFYVWFTSGVTSNEYYDAREKLMECFLFLGTFCAYSIMDQALRTYLTEGALFHPIVWSNDICEFMLFCMPAAFYYAKKNYIFSFVGVLFFAVMVFTNSISAMVCGALLLFLCLIYLAKNRPDKRVLTVVITALLIFSAVAVFVWLATQNGGLLAWFTEEENGRLQYAREAWENFLAAPLFGAGIGYPGDGTSTFMTIQWMHNFFFQILGSMGIVGILAYGYQLYARIRLACKLRDPLSVACFLSYLGLFFISMFQPGEFCPMPYALMAVMIFRTMEVAAEENDAMSKNAVKTTLSS